MNAQKILGNVPVDREVCGPIMYHETGLKDLGRRLGKTGFLSCSKKVGGNDGPQASGSIGTRRFHDGVQ